MEEKRILIPKELLDRSNLKGCNKVLFIFEDEKILLAPYEEDWYGLQVLGSRALDNKGRFSIPMYLHIEPEKVVVMLLNGEIWITRHPF